MSTGRAGRLDRDALRVMIGAQYAIAAESETRLPAYLHDHAEGNPFYTGEILRSLQGGGFSCGKAQAERSALSSGRTSHRCCVG